MSGLRATCRVFGVCPAHAAITSTSSTTLAASSRHLAAAVRSIVRSAPTTAGATRTIPAV
jgi:hypothetical protein